MASAAKKDPPISFSYYAYTYITRFLSETKCKYVTTSSSSKSPDRSLMRLKKVECECKLDRHTDGTIEEFIRVIKQCSEISYSCSAIL